MATRLPLSTGYRPPLSREAARRSAPVLAAAAGEPNAHDPGTFPAEARPVLRVAAALAGFALAGFAVVVVFVLALLGAL